MKLLVEIKRFSRDGMWEQSWIRRAKKEIPKLCDALGYAVNKLNAMECWCGEFDEDHECEPCQAITQIQSILEGKS